MSETVTAHEITITRVFDAPRELVWRAWTEPERLARWWGKRGWTAQLATIEMDVRAGGVFRVMTVNDEDGREMGSDGVYLEVVAPERLVFAEAADAGCPESQGTRGVVTFTDLGDGRTGMIFHTTMQTTDENFRQAQGGLSSAFDRLADQLSTEGS